MLCDASAGVHPSSEAGLEQLFELVERSDVAYLLAEAPAAIEQALGGITRLSTIVAAMAECARGAGKDRSGVDINHVIGNVLTVAFNETKYLADIETNLSPALPAIAAFAGEIDLAVLELVLAASRALAREQSETTADIPRRGRIVVETQRAGAFVELRVTHRAADSSGITQSAGDQPVPREGDDAEVLCGSSRILHDIVVGRHGGELATTSGPGGTTAIARLPLAL
jgi:two-component system, NtrC family, sensor kinase